LEGTTLYDRYRPLLVGATGHPLWVPEPPSNQSGVAPGAIIRDPLVVDAIVDTGVVAENPVKVLKAPEIGKTCQKKGYPVDSKQIRNGVKTLTDGRIRFPFYPCMTKIALELELNLKRWPPEMRPGLRLQIILDEYDQTVDVVALTNLARQAEDAKAVANAGRHKAGLVWLKIPASAGKDAEAYRLTLESTARDRFGIYEIEIVPDPANQFETFAAYNARATDGEAGR
jgi:hypothetical protein